jgi:hypothetical protein
MSNFDFTRVVKAESPLVVVDASEPKGDGMWRWRESNGEGYMAWLSAERANAAHVPQKPWTHR